MAGGGGAPAPSSPVEIAYAQITSPFLLADAGTLTDIPGLAITATVLSGVKYAMEFFTSALDENSGTTDGDVLEVVLSSDIAGDLGFGHGLVYNGVGGFGSALYIKSPTKVGAGVSHTYKARVLNTFTGSDGAIVHASGDSPAYVRLVSLS